MRRIPNPIDMASDLVAFHESSGRPHMTVAASGDEILHFAPRRKDRRLGIGDVLMALTRTLGDRSDAAAMRTAFEEVLQRVVPVRAVALRDATRWGKSEAPESIALEVPGAAPGVLEASFGPGNALGEWDLQDPWPRGAPGRAGA
jgi:hypothetical protein